MKEIERKNEFMEQLVDAEEIIHENLEPLDGVTIGEARKIVVGLEKNCDIIKLDPEEFRKNPYMKNIYVEDCMVGNIWLNNEEKFPKDRITIYDGRKRDPKTLTTKYSYFYFPEDVNHPSIAAFEGFTYRKWMGVEPSEMSTFAPFIEEAKGNILLMGCGIGYLAYMLSIREDVKKVTIIELDPTIKYIFETRLKPQMNDKIEIYEGDAIEFLEKNDISKYDYCSVDIWRGVNDMFPLYLKCMILESRHPNTKFHYWLEEEFHTALETFWIKILQQYINIGDSVKKDDFFTQVLDMQNLETLEDLKKFISSPKRPIIKNWAMAHKAEAYNSEGLVKTLIKVPEKLMRS